MEQIRKIALITGASSGIGRATAVQLSEAGYDLVLCGRRKERLEELAAQLKTDTVSLVFDVRNKSLTFDTLNGLPEEWKAIDVLVNNAGNAHGLEPIQDGDVQDWDMMIDGNVKGLLYVSKAVMPWMIERKKGHIINISSVAGKQTYANGAVYCASKAAVEKISEGMRLDLLPHGVKVTNIAPGAVNTEFSEVRFKGDEAKSEAVYRGYEPLIAEDIADAITYVVTRPARVQIADMTIFPSAQASATSFWKDD
ncbi:NADP-dependent 3-hydroxy acid dehydrogenase YdfG [Aureibacter tunicatorum]|uniref:NADP-dependent 3-hydroxy acid dehydrogenase YdfG n=1 Tax=Aureibacter tunicatorum TaxID=866807 RepID=A0AAE3XQL4_9BACT|nr:NADP-dependent 3-hydroxy acid dehydrogenase YdfG [Aureibacter tunicatorum]BDD05856.1 short-chain dehydrogenase [Aureibacter tunicatorum]